MVICIYWDISNYIIIYNSNGQNIYSMKASHVRIVSSMLIFQLTFTVIGSFNHQTHLQIFQIFFSAAGFSNQQSYQKLTVVRQNGTDEKFRFEKQNKIDYESFQSDILN